MFIICGFEMIKIEIVSYVIVLYKKFFYRCIKKWFKMYSI